MLNAMAFVAMFIIGGLSGIFMAATPVDMHIHDTYFIVGHIHYVLFGGSIFGIFAAIYYWFPKMFGRMMNERLGQDPLLPHVHLLQRHVLPDAHHRHARPSAADRRSDHLSLPPGAGIIGMNQFMTISAFLLGLTQIIFAVQLHLQPVRRAARPRPTLARQLAGVVDLVASAALQLRADPDGLPCPLRVQRPGRARTITCPRPSPCPTGIVLDPVMA